MRVTASRPTTKSRQNNTQALCVLDSYLTACKVPHEILDGKTGIDLRVQKKSEGDYANVSVQVDLFAADSRNTDIIVLVEDLMSLNHQEVLAAFHSVTEPLGWGKPIPVDRGPAPQGKVNDAHLVVIRHCEWRVAPDLPEHVFRSTYDSTIRFFSRLVLREPNSRRVVIDAQEDFDSLCVIGRIIAMNFHHKYRNLRATDTQNRTFFAAHWKQRLQNAIDVWRKQRVNTLPDDQTVAISLTGDVNGDLEAFDPTKEKSEDHSYLLKLSMKEVRALPEEQRLLRNALLAKDRAVHSGLGRLDERLGPDHLERMRMLSEVVTRDTRHIDPDALSLARKKLVIEMGACQSVDCPYNCKGVLNQASNDDEESGDSLAEAC